MSRDRDGLILGSSRNPLVVSEAVVAERDSQEDVVEHIAEARESVLKAKSRPSGLLVPPSAEKDTNVAGRRPPSAERSGPVVMAPVGNDRAWVMEAYADCLRVQTLAPSAIVFLLSPGSGAVREAIGEIDWPVKPVLAQTKERFFTREQRTKDPSDPNRTEHFSRLRNQLRTAALATGGRWFLSLDTDILLDDPTAVQQLRDHLYVPEEDGTPALEGRFDAVAPTVYLSPGGARQSIFNVGWFVAGDPGSKQRIWQRADQNDFLSRHSPVPVGTVMAAFAARRSVFAGCKYSGHELGEDLGFADSMDRHGFSCGWLKDLHAPHMWGPSYLDAFLGVTADA